MTRKKPEISVVMPVYNTEAYLEKCFDSVLSQTFNDIEVIAVNDGSTDSSAEICKEYATKDRRVRVIQTPNKGLSMARNMGINAACGNFISFLDSDDFIDKRFLEVLYNDIISTNADISICGYIRSNEAYTFSKKDRLKAPRIVSGRVAFEQLLLGGNLSGGVTAWNKLYKADIFRNIRFPEGRFFEDSAIMYKLYFKSSSISIRSDKLYCYVKRAGSIVDSEFQPSSLQRLTVAHEVMDFVSANCPEFIENARCFTLISAMRLLADIIASGVSKYPNEYADVKDLIDKNKNCSQISFRHKMMLALLNISPGLYLKIYQTKP